MKVSYTQLKAIVSIAHDVFHSDEFCDEAAAILVNFIYGFFNSDYDESRKLYAAAREMDSEDAMHEIKNIDDRYKQEISNLFADIMLANGAIYQKEAELFLKLVQECDLPMPNCASWERYASEDSSEEEPLLSNEEEYDNEKIREAVFGAGAVSPAHYLNGEWTAFLTFDINGCSYEDCLVCVYFYDTDGNPLRDTNKKYCTTDGDVAVKKTVSPNSDSYHVENLKITMPYEELHLDNSTKDFMFQVQIYNSVTKSFIGQTVKYSDYVLRLF